MGVTSGPVASCGVVVLTYACSALLPGTLVDGYCIDPSTGRPQKYKLNGLRVLLVVVAAFAAAVEFGVVDPTVFYHEFGACAATATVIGILASVAFLIRGRLMLAKGAIDRRSRCETRDSIGLGTRPTTGTEENKRRSASPATRRRRLHGSEAATLDTTEFDSRSLLDHFYCGLSEFNPRGWLGVDVKMWLYVVGAVQLQLNVLSCLMALPASLALRCYCGLMTFFLVEYLYQEAVHLQTYDLFRERIGFKLLFGCIAFYPWFYATGGWAVARWGAEGSDLPGWAAALIVALFFCGWTLTRGANLQKAACKEGKKKFSFLFGLIKPSMATVPGSGGRLLSGGFWGVSRHVNYCGEIVQAVALSLPAVWAAGGIRLTGSTADIALSLLPLLYPLYYVALFIPRCIDDGRMCERKYGREVWGAYCKRVRWNMLPGVW